MLTKEGQEAANRAWDRYQDPALKHEQALDFLAEKVAGDLVASGVYYENARRPGLAIKMGEFELPFPKTAEEANAGLAKLADYWKNSLKSIGDALANVVSGGHGSQRVLSRDMFGQEILSEARKSLEPLEKNQLALAGALVAVPLAAGAVMAHNAAKKHRHAVVLNQIMADPAFENVTDQSKVKDAYNMMVRYSPSIALDPMVSKSFVEFLVTHPDMAGLQSAQQLMEAEHKFRESGEFSSNFTERVRKMLKHPIIEPFSGGGGGGGGGKKGK